MTIHHHENRFRPFALALSLLLAPALSAEVQAQDAKSARGNATSQAAAEPAAQPSASGVINLNSASLEELTRLPGVGPARAQAIVELRTRMNGFKSVEDLMRVRGIGRKTFRKLEPMLRLQGATTLAETRGPSRRPAATAQR